MVEKLTNFTKKSFNDYSMTDKLKFKSKNIIFGVNGRGKSAFAQGVIDEHLKNNPSENLRYFYGDYLQEELLLEETQHFKGVKATFGKKDIGTNKKIKELEKQIVDISKMQESVNKKRNELRRDIDNIHENKKGKLRISKKASGHSIEKILELYKADIESAKAIESNEKELLRYDGNGNELESLYEQALKIELPDLILQDLTSEDLKKINNIFEESYKDLEIPSSKVIEWLETGIILHSDDEKTCKFCQNSMKLSEVKERVEKYSKNKKQLAIKFLEIKQQDIKTNISKLESAAKYKSPLGFVFGESQMEELLNFENEIKCLKKFNEEINKKLMNLNKSFEARDILEIKETMENINRKNEQLFKLKNERINDLNQKRNKFEVLVKGSIGLSIFQNLNVEERLEIIGSNEKEIKTVKNNNDKISLDISRLKEGYSDYSDFKNFINGVLTSLNIQIKLCPDNSGNNYYLKHSIEDINLEVKDISEGEKNLLALMFFYYELYEDNLQKKEKDNVKLIVIDDPINSLDESNRFYVIEILKSILDSNFDQIFLFTHSWNDYCDITYNKKDSICNFYEICKDSGGKSYIKQLKTGIHPYKKLFVDIYELSRKNVEDIEDSDYAYYYSVNGMRRVFEEYLRFKGRNNILPQSSYKRQIEEVFRLSTGREISRNKKPKLGEFLSFINILSHKAYRPASVLEHAKFLMWFIEETDKAHHDAMTN